MVTIKGLEKLKTLKKGDIIKVDGKAYEVDAHMVLIDHGNTKEMAIELFDPKSDHDYQLRYFADRIEDSIQFYVLKEIMYEEVEITKIEF